jgi:glucose-1-phosphatase
MSLKPARPSLVIFDMDEVLCHYDLGRRLRFLANIADTTVRNVRAALWDSEFEGQSDAGAYPDSDEYLAEFSKRLGFDLTRQQWLDARRFAMTANPEVLNIARAIKSQAELAIYTNNGPLVKENFAALLPEAADIFERYFCSYEFGTKKPDPESFTRLLDFLKRDAKHCWFIDDKKSNVQGAEIAGLTGHHFRHADLLADDARQLGFEL